MITSHSLSGLFAFSALTKLLQLELICFHLRIAIVSAVKPFQILLFKNNYSIYSFREVVPNIAIKH